MKKIIIVILALGAAMSICFADGRSTNTQNIISTISEYKEESGVEVISIGKFGIGLAKFVADLSVETEEERAALALLNDINRVVVVDYEDASEASRHALTSKLSDLFSRSEKIMEVKDDEDTVNIYGTSVNGGESIDDLMFFIPADCTLICILGSISSERMADLIKIANE